jgi:hypothetical protein
MGTSYQTKARWSIWTIGLLLKSNYYFLLCACRISRAMLINRFQHRAIVFFSAAALGLAVVAAAPDLAFTLVFLTSVTDLAGLLASDFVGDGDSVVSFDALRAFPCSGFALSANALDAHKIHVPINSHFSSLLISLVLIG